MLFGLTENTIEQGLFKMVCKRLPDNIANEIIASKENISHLDKLQKIV